jgi:hypothetical protein
VCLALLPCVLVAAACSFPTNDIVSTTTEDVGPYKVISAAADDSLTARVCVASPNHADQVVQKIVQQLKSHEYAMVTLDVYAARGPIARYVWTGQGERRQGLSDEGNPCKESGRAGARS